MESGDPSPLSPRGLRDLYLRPRTFFARSNLTAKPAILIAVWIMGMAHVIQRIDWALLADEFFDIEVIPSLAAARSWPLFWSVVIGVGVLYGFLVWLFGGWWYRIRLELSGTNYPDSNHARAVYTYQSIIEDIPTLLMTVGLTFAFTNYWEASDSDELATTIFGLLFLIWSFFTSYIGARSFPDVTKGKAIFWFVILPIVFYVVLIFGLAILAVIYGPESP